MRKAIILVVEDDSDILESIREYLESKEYQVLAAKSMAEARAQLQQSPPDLVLLDVMLPDGSGFDFCSELRRAHAMPVIYVTCRGESGDVVRGLELGGSDYIVKPYDMKVLEARIAARLRDTGLFLSARRIELPPLSLDLITGEATLGGKPVRLSQKELQLLAFLADHIGQRIGRDRLYEAVWGTPANKNTHTVTEHVHRLRKKLHMDGEESVFKIVSEEQEYMFCKVRY